jgi:hypothetical protein
MAADRPGRDRWIAEQLKNAPSLADDPERARRMLRLLGIPAREPTSAELEAEHAARQNTGST